MYYEWFGTLSEWIAMTLINGVVGGILLVVLLWFGVKTLERFRSVNASTRYTVWATGLVLCVALIVWQGVRNIPESTHHLPVLGATSDEVKPLSMALPPPPLPEELRIAKEEAPAITQKGTEALGFEQPEAVVYNGTVSEQSWIDEVLPGAVYTLSLNAPPPLISQVIVVIWVILCGVFFSRLLFSGILVRRIKKEAASASPSIGQILSHWVRAIGSRSVEAGVSNSIKSAAAVGYLHPMILLPEQMIRALDRSEVEQVVLHELAHIRRFDDWTILVQQLVTALLFFIRGSGY